jgi:hypothetical protein
MRFFRRASVSGWFHTASANGIRKLRKADADIEKQRKALVGSETIIAAYEEVIEKQNAEMLELRDKVRPAQAGFGIVVREGPPVIKPVISLQCRECGKAPWAAAGGPFSLAPGCPSLI